MPKKRVRAENRGARGEFTSDAAMVAAEEGPKSAAKKTVRRREKTERAFLDAILREFGPSDFYSIARAIREKAEEADPAAMAWVGKYLLGNGKIGLDEVSWPSMIRKSRR